MDSLSHRRFRSVFRSVFGVGIGVMLVCSAVGQTGPAAVDFGQAPPAPTTTCVSCLNASAACSSSSDTLYVGGLFPMGEGWGRENAAHFELAARLINNKSDGWFDKLLPNTTLRVHVEDSACEPDPAVRATWRLVRWPKEEGGHNLNAIVGAACSGASYAASYLTSVLELPQVSYSATSPDLSGRDPYFFRTCPPDTGVAKRLVGLLQHFGWSHVGILTADSTFGKHLASEFGGAWTAQELALHGTHSVGFDADDAIDASAAESSISSLHSLGVRLIFVAGHLEHVEKLLGVADDMGLSDVVFVTTTQPDVRKFSNIGNVLGLVEVEPQFTDSLRYRRLWEAQSGEEYFDEDGDRSTLDIYDWNVADALFTIATAYDARLGAASDSDDASSEVSSAALRDEIAATRLDGVSGPVFFDGYNDRGDSTMTVVFADADEDTGWREVGTVRTTPARCVFPFSYNGIEYDECATVDRPMPWCATGTDSSGRYNGQWKACGADPEDEHGVVLTSALFPPDQLPDDFIAPWPWWVVDVLIPILVVAVAAVLLYFRWSLDKLRQLEAATKELTSGMRGMYKIVQDMPRAEFLAQHGLTECDIECPDTTAPRPGTVLWYWEEDAEHLAKHNAGLVLSGTNFVQYSFAVCHELEDAHQQWQAQTGKKKKSQVVSLNLANKISTTGNELKANNEHTGYDFTVDFAAMTQSNKSSGHKRKVRRQETVSNPLHKSGGSGAMASVSDLPPPPAGVAFDDEAGEGLLPARAGQVVQISKEENNWLYGNVLHDPNPSSSGAVQSTSGWFPKAIAAKAGTIDIRKIAEAIGGGIESLAPPTTWTTSAADAGQRAQLVEVTDPHEYRTVTDTMEASLPQDHGLRVTSVQRVENHQMWQSFAVKRQTVLTRDDHGVKRVNNKGDLERAWLFHGTTADTVPKITQQGFNRAFAGKNAVAYGRGVYYARDASYSDHYAVADASGNKFMFMCRLVAGDWCKGSNGVLTPKVKPGTENELFDTTVDHVRHPSIFVAYHDAQAYPEYLVSFKSVKKGGKKKKKAFAPGPAGSKSKGSSGG